MSECSYNDNLSHHTDKESQVPLVSSRARSNDEISYNSPSPVNVATGIIQQNTSGLYASGNSGHNNPQPYPADRKQNSFYSPLAFKDDTMFTGTLGHNYPTTRNEKLLFTVLCQFCGQFHEKNTPHLYDYSEATDSTLLCIICNQPLVDPIETKCRHTFCKPCLDKHLLTNNTCPHDDFKIDKSECKEAPVIVKKLLDKLLVVCPNVDYCEEILVRSELYNHLKFKCRGAIIPCVNAHLGCTFQGSRNSFSAHQWECRYKNMENGQDPVTVHQQYYQQQYQQQQQHHHQMLQQPSHPSYMYHASSQQMIAQQQQQHFQQHQRHPMYFQDEQCIVDNEDMLDEDQLQHHIIQMPDVDFSIMPFPKEGLEKNQIIPGTPTEIEIVRINQCDLGFSFVGGIDSPLGCIIIQEVYLDGLISQDGRLRPGDEIKMVNGNDLTLATHAYAKRLLSSLDPMHCRLVVFREKAPSEYETFSVNLPRKSETQLGLVLDKKKNCDGIYIRSILANSEAFSSGRLAKGDRILSINNVDMLNGSQQDAVETIKDARDNVHLIVRRRISVPDVVKTTDDRISLGSWSTSSTGAGGGGGGAPSNHPSNHSTGGSHHGVWRGPHSDMISRRISNTTQQPHQSPSGGSMTNQKRSGGAWSSSDPAHSSSSFKSSPDHNPTHQPPLQYHQSPHHSSSQQSSSHHSITGPPPPSSNIPPPLNIPPPPLSMSSPQNQYGMAPVEQLASSFSRAAIDRQITHGSDNYQIMSPLPIQCKEETLQIMKSPNASLSITVAGGLESQRGNVPIYVTKIFPNGVLSQYKKVKKGSVLVAINNQTLIGLRHQQAVETLKRECYGHSTVTLHYIEGAETSSGAGNFMPSWKFWLQLPQFCAYPQIVELYKDNANSGLGFSIVGGVDNNTVVDLHNGNNHTPQTVLAPGFGGFCEPNESMGIWSTCIMIKTILPNSIAFHNGKLKCGDILLEVNNYPLYNISHSDAVKILKKTQNRVTLKIISWPGTIV